MKLYKCEDCGFIASEILGECPICHSDKNPLVTSTLELEGAVFTLVDEDIRSVIECMSEEEQEMINKHSDKTIMDTVSRKMEIPWTEYVESFLRAKFCYQLNWSK